MAIKTDVDVAAVDIGTGDTTLLSLPSGVERFGVTAMSFHNNSASAKTVTLYESPDTTSASGKVVAYYSLEADESSDVSEIIGQGYKTTNIIGKASASGVSSRATITTYTEGD